MNGHAFWIIVAFCLFVLWTCAMIWAGWGAGADHEARTEAKASGRHPAGKKPARPMDETRLLAPSRPPGPRCHMCGTPHVAYWDADVPGRWWCARCGRPVEPEPLAVTTGFHLDPDSGPQEQIVAMEAAMGDWLDRLLSDYPVTEES